MKRKLLWLGGVLMLLLSVGLWAQAAPVDSCPPVMSYWEPFPGDTGVSPTAYVRAAYLHDDPGICDTATGVDTSTITMVIVIDGFDTLDVTSELTIDGYDGWDVWWYHDSFPFPEGSHIVACIDFADFAGNWAHSCTEFDVVSSAPPVDSCPPVFYSWHPAHSDTLCPPDTPIWFMVADSVDGCDCSGIADTSIYVQLYVSPDMLTLYPDGGLILEHIDPCHIKVTLDPAYYSTWVGWEYASDYGVEMWTSASDNAGNTASDGNFFYVCDIPVDGCPPITNDWMPSDGAIGVSRDYPIYVQVLENCADSCFDSGVDTSTIHLWVTDNTGISIDVTGEAEISPSSYCDGYAIEWHHSWLWDFGDTVHACVEAHDYAGNPLEECITFVIEEDDCPPVVDHWYPLDGGCIPWDAMLGVMLVDPMDSFDCPVASGVDIGSIMVYYASGDDSLIDITGDCDITGAGSYGGVSVQWHHPYFGFPPDEDVTLCVGATDYMGNPMDSCYIWHTCPDTITPPDTTDDTPPCIVELHPLPGVTVGADVPVWVHFCDLCRDTSLYASGVDPESIHMTVDGVDVSDMLMLDELYCLGYAAFWAHDPLSIGEHTVCAWAYDYAGNATDTCWTFYIEGIPGDTICHIDIDAIHPGDGDTVRRSPVTLSADFIGSHDIGVGYTYLYLFDGISWTIYGYGDLDIETHTSSWITASMGFDSLPPGDYTACWYGELTDTTGTWCWDSVYRCVEFVVAGSDTITPPDTTDDTAPCVVGVNPFPGTTVSADTPVWVHFCDLCWDSSSLYASGVDSESIHMTVDGVDVSDMLTLDELYCLGYAASWAHDPLSIGEHTVCAWAYDYAGNATDTCWTFYIEGTPGDTICHIDIDAIHPGDGDTVRRSPVTLSADFIGTHDIAVEWTFLDFFDGTSWTIYGYGDLDIETHTSSWITASMGFDSLPPGDYTACWSGALVWDTTGVSSCWDSVYQCVEFVVAGSDTTHPDSTDTWAPCVEWGFEDGDTILPTDDGAVSLCDVCPDAEFYTGVDLATVSLSYRIDGDTTWYPLTFTADPIYCAGYALWFYFYPPPPAGSYITLCVEASDLAGNRTEDCITLYVRGGVPGEYSIVSPFDGAHTSCGELPIIFTVPYDAPDTFFVDGELYSLSTSPEVTRAGDTVIFTPSTPWSEGDVHITVGTLSWHFVVDLTPPTIRVLLPAVESTVPLPIPEIHIGITDAYSPIDDGSINVIIDGIAYTISTPGVDWASATGVLTIYTDEAGVVMEPGDTVSVCAYAADIIDYCSFHLADTCYEFIVADTTHPPIHRYIAGRVTDDDTGDPIDIVEIDIYRYMHSWMPLYTTYSDADGYYAIEVGSGIYAISATDAYGDYTMEFFDNRDNPLEADPVVIGVASPETTYADFQLARVFSSFFRVCGEVREVGEGPIADAYVIFSSSDEDGEDWSVRTDDLGQYEIMLPVGDYFSLAYKGGYIPQFYGDDRSWLDADTVYVYGDVDSIGFELESVSHDTSGLYRISGYVFDSTDAKATLPLRGVRVYLQNTLNLSMFSQITDTAGYFEFAGLTEGNYILFADKSHRWNIGTMYHSLVLPSSDTSWTIYMTPEEHTAVEEHPVSLPKLLMVVAYPNPFNSSATIVYTIDHPTKAVIGLYNSIGILEREVDMGIVSTGTHRTVLSCEDLPSGTYIIKLTTDDYTQSTRIQLIR